MASEKSEVNFKNNQTPFSMSNPQQPVTWSQFSKQQLSCLEFVTWPSGCFSLLAQKPHTFVLFSNNNMYQNTGFAHKLGKTLNILISDDLKSVLDNIGTTFTKKTTYTIDLASTD